MNMPRTVLRNILSRLACQVIPSGVLTNRAFFDHWERKGVHILPVDYYQPIPDTRALPDELWNRYSQLPGIELNLNRQLALLAEFANRYKAEYEAFAEVPTDDPTRYHAGQIWFPWLDAAILHCMIRHYKPRRIIEVGSGFSTLVSAAAIRQNEREDGRGCELTAIEPYPNEQLRRGLPGLTRLINEPVQQVPLEEFRKLEAGDILFIDSSHVVKIGGDVTYEYLEILPRLNEGVLVHAHDIFLPWDYPPEWIKELRQFWSEQYLLQAFLACNDAFEVLWAGHYMHLKQEQEMAQAFSFMRQRNSLPPASFWIRKKGDGQGRYWG